MYLAWEVFLSCHVPELGNCKEAFSHTKPSCAVNLVCFTPETLLISQSNLKGLTSRIYIGSASTKNTPRHIVQLALTYSECSIHCSNMCHFPTIIIQFAWSQKSTTEIMYNYIRWIVPESVIVHAVVHHALSCSVLGTLWLSMHLFTIQFTLTSSKLPSIVLYWRSVIDRMRSPTRIKSPFVFRYSAIMLLKWLHSNLSSFSAVHSNKRTCMQSICPFSVHAHSKAWLLASSRLPVHPSAWNRLILIGWVFVTFYI